MPVRERQPAIVAGKNSAAVALGKKGGPARAEALTPEQRSEIAQKASLARWGKKKPKEKKKRKR